MERMDGVYEYEAGELEELAAALAGNVGYVFFQ
jgi:hypothetical protein